MKKYGHRSYELLRDRSSDGKEEQKPKVSSDEDEEEEPNQVDLIYFCGDFEWDEDFGGLTVYNDAQGEQVRKTKNSMSASSTQSGITNSMFLCLTQLKN